MAQIFNQTKLFNTWLLVKFIKKYPDFNLCVIQEHQTVKVKTRLNSPNRSTSATWITQDPQSRQNHVLNKKHQEAITPNLWAMFHGTHLQQSKNTKKVAKWHRKVDLQGQFDDMW